MSQKRNGNSFETSQYRTQNGKVAYSAVKNVRISANGKVSIYPNPTVDAINISLGEMPASDWRVSIINNSRQVIVQNKYSKKYNCSQASG